MHGCLTQSPKVAKNIPCFFASWRLCVKNDTIARMAEPLQFVGFRVGAQQFAIEIHRVTEVRSYSNEITPLPGASAFVEGMIECRRQLIPLIDMRKRLSVPEISNTMRTRILIVRTDRDSIGMIVDEADQVYTIPVENILPPPEQASDFVLAVAKHEQLVLLILDVEMLLQGMRAISAGPS
jgi:purine-binding chemotaxis protein CheW